MLFWDHNLFPGSKFLHYPLLIYFQRCFIKRVQLWTLFVISIHLISAISINCCLIRCFQNCLPHSSALLMVCNCLQYNFIHLEMQIKFINCQNSRKSLLDAFLILFCFLAHLCTFRCAQRIENSSCYITCLEFW